MTALTGLHSVVSAHLYYESLQSGLDSIFVKGDNVDELWCIVDWHRYILKSWIEVKKQGHRGPQESWFHMTNTWLHIIDAMVDLSFNYALPSQHQQRSILQERDLRGSPNLRNILRRSNSDEHPPIMDLIIDHQRAWTDPQRKQKRFDGWVDDTPEASNELIEHQQDAWTDSPSMQKPFRKLATGIRRNIKDTLSEGELQLQRQCGIESSDFHNFLEEIEEKIKELITLLPEEEHEKLYLALEKAFQTALYNRPRHDAGVRYMRFIQMLINTWLPSNLSIRPNVDAGFQQEIQKTLEDGIAPYGPWIPFRTYDPPLGPGIPFTTQDLQDTIALGADIRGRVHDREDCSLLEAAGSQCSIDLFKALVDAGAPYTIEPDQNRSPLQAAAEGGNIDILAFLLNSKNHSFRINVNHADANGETALHSAAAWTCEKQAVDMLLQHPDVDVNVRNHEGDTPFLLAVQGWGPDQYAVVRRFLEDKRVDCYCKSTRLSNALHYAAMLKDATLSIILRHVRSINATAWNGDTPLHCAVSANSKPNVRLLLRNGADPTVVSGFGTPLQLACHELHLGPMKELLSLPRSLDKQWRISADDLEDDYNTGGGGSRVPRGSPVTLVLRDLLSNHSKKEIGYTQRALKLVLAAKPDLEHRNCKGQSVLSVLSLSILEGHRHILIDVLRAGANVNSQDNDGNSPSHLLLCRYAQVDELFKILLKWGADPDLTNKQGKTAIAAAHPINPYTNKLRAIVREHKANVLVAQETKNPRQQKVKKSSLRSMSNPFSVLANDE